MTTMTPAHRDPDRRVLFFALTAGDASMTEAVVSRTGIALETCPTVDTLLEEAQTGCAALLIPEEIMSAAFTAELVSLLSRQPTWSDLPILILTRQGAD